MAANATADGYTLFMASTSTYVAPLLQAKPSYRPIEDFAAVAQVAAITSVVLTPMSLPVKSVKELIEWTKARPATMNFGSVGAGTAGHLSAEIFNRATGIAPVHVPFKGFSDLLLNNLAFFFVPAGVSLMFYYNQIKASFLSIIVSAVVSTIIVLVVTGWVHQIMRKKQSNETISGE